MKKNHTYCFDVHHNTSVYQYIMFSVKLNSHYILTCVILDSVLAKRTFFFQFLSAGVATVRKLPFKTWQLFYTRFLSWHNLGLISQPQDYWTITLTSKLLQPPPVDHIKIRKIHLISSFWNNFDQYILLLRMAFLCNFHNKSLAVTNIN